ncbi:uroporphyrinogen-III synthase [Lichenicoccus sp.]|uniref:uroporphyrinogen-III synthase n=1 Tax=Lichenicoccus sp. TaxID=2781899 RepID=UPI003D09B8C3
MPVRNGVLVTRPEPGLSETMAAVARLGFSPVACPLLRITGRPARLPASCQLDAILLTSGQAVAAMDAAARGDPDLRALPVFAVGDSTASRMRAAGFARTHSAAGDADDLAALVCAQMPAPAALLLATGSGQGRGLAMTLRAHGYGLHRRAVYAARPMPRLAPAAEAALRDQRIAACLFFSAETARTFAQTFAQTFDRCPLAPGCVLDDITALVLSAAVGEALAGLTWRSVRIAPRPEASALLALLHDTRRNA